MKEDNAIILGVVSWILVVFTLFSMLVIYEKRYSPLGLSIESEDVIKHCSNLNLFLTAQCLNNEVKSFYKYAPRNERTYQGDQGSLQDVITNGGDCSDYSNIYVSFARQLGFKAKETDLFPDNRSSWGHTYAVIYDRKELTGYCIMDQTEYWCEGLGPVNLDEVRNG